MCGRSKAIAGIVFFAAVVALCAWNLRAGGRDSMVGRAHAQTPPPNLKDPNLLAEGEKLFATTCSVPYCHGKEGATGRAPALRDRRWDVTELRDTILRGIPNSSMPNFDDKLSERQIWAVAGYILSLGSEAPAKKGSASAVLVSGPSPAAGGSNTMLSPSLSGDPSRGEQLFFESIGERGCAGCHSIDGKGNSVGPDLSGFSRRSARDLFEKIVMPSARIDSAYQLLRITMKDGEKINAIKKEETPTAVRAFDLGSSSPVLRRLVKDQIQTMDPSRESAMPSRYGELYSLRELLDLISFLKSSGAAAPVNVTYVDIR